MGDVNKRREIFFLFLNLRAVSKKSTPRKFAHIRHFRRIGINATKSEKTLNHFKSDVFAAVANVDAKRPQLSLVATVKAVAYLSQTFLIDLC